MENLKKNPLSLQLNVEDFAPASNDEKKSLVVMRESVNFWKDGMRRLRKNKIAMVSLGRAGHHRQHQQGRVGQLHPDAPRRRLRRQP